MRSSFASGIRTGRSLRRRFRAGLEALDARLVPAVYNAATVADLIADINAANKANGSDTINLAAGVVFDLTVVDNTIDGADGLPVISARNGNDLTIVGNGAVIERSATSGTPAFRLFDVPAGASLTLHNLTLRNGLAQGDGSAGDGGAILSRGTLRLSGVTVQNNVAQGADRPLGFQKKTPLGTPGGDAAGGGVWTSGTLALDGGTALLGNQAAGGRGGYGYVTVNAGTGGGGYGGALYVAGGTVTATGATFTGNLAVGGVGGRTDGPPSSTTTSQGGTGGRGAGGGICLAAGSLTLSGGSIASDEARGGLGGYDSTLRFPGRGGDAFGGALADFGGSAALTSVSITLDIARGGQGGLGGGDQAGGPGGNAYGGGLYVTSATVTLSTVTVSSDQAVGGDPGSGYYGYGGPGPGVGYGSGIYLAADGSLSILAGSSVINDYGDDLYRLGLVSISSDSTVGIIDP